MSGSGTAHVVRVGSIGGSLGRGSFDLDNPTCAICREPSSKKHVCSVLSLYPRTIRLLREQFPIDLLGMS